MAKVEFELPLDVFSNRGCGHLMSPIHSNRMKPLNNNNNGVSSSSSRYPYLMSLFGSKCKCFHPVDDCVFQLDIPELAGATLCFSKYGWLLLSRYNSSRCNVSESVDYCFFNPCTMERIDLPSYPLPFAAMCFSSPPTTPSCYVIGLYPYRMGTAIFRLGEKDWDYVDFDFPINTPWYCHPIIYQQRCFYMGEQGRLTEFDLHNVSSCIMGEMLLFPEEVDCAINRCFLVEDEEQLLVVVVPVDEEECPYVMTFDLVTKVWQPVESLGRKVVYISLGGSFTAKAVTMDYGNRIYFPKVRGENCIFYSLTTKKYHSSYGDYSEESLDGKVKEMTNCCWIISSLPNREIEITTGAEKEEEADTSEEGLQAKPLLFILEEESCRLYSISEEAYYENRIPHLQDEEIVRYIHGWFVLRDEQHNYCLFNPSSLEKLELPPLDSEFEYTSCVLSSPPTHPNCHVLFVGNDKILFCKLGDKEYTSKEFDDDDNDYSTFSDATSFKGKVYYLAYKDTLLSIDCKASGLEIIKLLPAADLGEERLLVACTSKSSRSEAYLVESCDGELLLVHKMYHSIHPNWVSDIMIYRFDFAANTWEELDNIGKQTIFLSRNGSLLESYCVVDCGVKENCVYYVDSYDENLRVFDLDDRSFSRTTLAVEDAELTWVFLQTLEEEMSSININ